MSCWTCNHITEWVKKNLNQNQTKWKSSYNNRSNLAGSMACFGCLHPEAHVHSIQLPMNVGCGHGVGLHATSSAQMDHHTLHTARNFTFLHAQSYTFYSDITKTYKIPWTAPRLMLVCSSTKSGSRCPSSRPELNSDFLWCQPDRTIQRKQSHG